MTLYPYGDGYHDGAKDATNYARRIHRTNAFGAIRRAAKNAREHDRQAELYRNDKWEPFRDIEELQCARAIRRAIRAAIGSDKA